MSVIFVYNSSASVIKLNVIISIQGSYISITMEGHRESVKSEFDFSKNSFQSSCFDDFDDDDPIGAYFKQRLAKSKKTDSNQINSKTSLESDGGSSLGVLDVDNMSLIGGSERYSSIERTLHGSLAPSETKQIESERPQKRISDYDLFKRPYPLNTEFTEAEANLKKQRALAQMVLSRVKNQEAAGNNKLIEPSKMEVSNDVRGRPSSIINPLSTKYWLESNQSPCTPRFFRNELSSVTSEELSDEPTSGGSEPLLSSVAESFQFLEVQAKQEFPEVDFQNETPAIEAEEEFQIQSPG